MLTNDNISKEKLFHDEREKNRQEIEQKQRIFNQNIAIHIGQKFSRSNVPFKTKNKHLLPMKIVVESKEIDGNCKQHMTKMLSNFLNDVYIDYGFHFRNDRWWNWHGNRQMHESQMKLIAHQYKHWMVNILLFYWWWWKSLVSVYCRLKLNI